MLHLTLHLMNRFDENNFAIITFKICFYDLERSPLFIFLLHILHLQQQAKSVSSKGFHYIVIIYIYMYYII
jgi:hypothetical protein